MFIFNMDMMMTMFADMFDVQCSIKPFHPSMSCALCALIIFYLNFSLCLTFLLNFFFLLFFFYFFLVIIFFPVGWLDGWDCVPVNMSYQRVPCSKRLKAKKKKKSKTKSNQKEERFLYCETNRIDNKYVWWKLNEINAHDESQRKNHHKSK